MTPMTEEQHKVVRRVLERLEQFPETYNQQLWYGGGRDHLRESSLTALLPGGDQVLNDDEVEALRAKLVIDVAQMSECGTAACIAGHTILAAYELGIPLLEDSWMFSDVAKALLGVDEHQADSLFAGGENNARNWVATAAETGSWDHVD